jgi:hypothetical protein
MNMILTIGIVLVIVALAMMAGTVIYNARMLMKEHHHEVEIKKVEEDVQNKDPHK